jgi:hypothetical protein
MSLLPPPYHSWVSCFLLAPPADLVIQHYFKLFKDPILAPPLPVSLLPFI